MSTTLQLDPQVKELGLEERVAVAKLFVALKEDDRDAIVNIVTAPPFRYTCSVKIIIFITLGEALLGA